MGMKWGVEDVLPLDAGLAKRQVAHERIDKRSRVRGISGFDRLVANVAATGHETEVVRLADPSEQERSPGTSIQHTITDR